MMETKDEPGLTPQYIEAPLDVAHTVPEIVDDIPPEQKFYQAALGLHEQLGQDPAPGSLFTTVEDINAGVGPYADSFIRSTNNVDELRAAAESLNQLWNQADAILGSLPPEKRGAIAYEMGLLQSAFNAGRFSLEQRARYIDYRRRNNRPI